MLISTRTGVTGYVGGTVFNTLVTAHPEYSITVLLRDPKPSFSEKYPNVKVIKGDFESTELLKDAASKADIVVRTFLPGTAQTKHLGKLTRNQTTATRTTRPQ